MKKMIKIIRKIDVERQYREVLLIEQDYELASLFHAMQQNDILQVRKSKIRLTEIQEELVNLSSYK